MKTILKFVAMLWAVSALAQSTVTEIRATAEHPLSGASADLAKQLALDDATGKVLQGASSRLQSLAEVKSLQLKPVQIDAFALAILNVEEQAVRPGVPAGRVDRADVLVRLDVAEAVRRMRLLRKDQEATDALVDLWQQTQELHRRLLELVDGGKNEQEQQLILIRLRTKHLAAQVCVALARTEQGMTSALVPSEEGRIRARQLAESALAAAPDLPDAHDAMGDVLLDAGETQAAEAEYRKALLEDPGSSSGHAKLAGALRLQNKLPDAAAELREALRINPDSVPAHTDLGIVLAAQNKADEAVVEYKTALRLDPDFIDAHNNLAIALARQRRIPAAVEEFREIVRIDPDSALGYFNMASALADMEKDSESAEALREVVRINPNHFNAHYNLGELFRLEEKFDEAVKQFREYVRLVPDTPQNQRNIRRAKDFIQAHENP